MMRSTVTHRSNRGACSYEPEPWVTLDHAYSGDGDHHSNAWVVDDPASDAQRRSEHLAHLARVFGKDCTEEQIQDVYDRCDGDVIHAVEQLELLCIKPSATGGLLNGGSLTRSINDVSAAAVGIFKRLGYHTSRGAHGDGKGSAGNEQGPCQEGSRGADDRAPSVAQASSIFQKGGSGGGAVIGRRASAPSDTTLPSDAGNPAGTSWWGFDAEGPPQPPQAAGAPAPVRSLSLDDGAGGRGASNWLRPQGSGRWAAAAAAWTMQGAGGVNKGRYDD